MLQNINQATYAVALGIELGALLDHGGGAVQSLHNLRDETRRDDEKYHHYMRYLSLELDEITGCHCHCH